MYILLACIACSVKWYRVHAIRHTLIDCEVYMHSLTVSLNRTFPCTRFENEENIYV